MKFTDGNWMLQPGVKAHYAAEASTVNEEDGALVVYAPTRPIRHRGDTLQGPLLTIRINSPMPDIIRVRIEHFSGGIDRGPHIPLQPVSPPPVAISLDESAATLTSGNLSARVHRMDGFALSFHSGDREITRSGFRGIGFIEHDELGTFIHEQLALGVGENVYGLGERFTAFVKNGQVVENWNRDGGTGCDQAYKSVPFYMTNRGYGVLVNETGPVSFEVASEKVSRVQFSMPGESIEYFVINGPTPKEVLANLTALTGRPALPPAWSFGLWLTTSFTTSYDEKTVNSFVDEMKTRDLPLHVFHFDCFWMKEFEWCNLRWDDDVFPDPAGMLQRLHEKGLRVCVWINPYIGQKSPLFAEGKTGGFLLKKTDGSIWQSDQWQPGMAIVDFTNPDARKWYGDHLRRLVDMGVDTFKTDFGERIPTDVVWHDGSDPTGMHNHYPVIFNETVFSVLEEKRGRGDAVVFARSAHASGQRFPAHWGGDCNSTFESMAESLRGGLSLGMCGFGFWSHDIGGFEGHPPAAIYKRWIAFGLLSSHSRLHGSSSYRVPWNYDDEACDVLRFFTKLKCRLMPYLFQKAVEATTHGVPVMRAMVIEFPDDPACHGLERQYLLGDSLLVAPVFSDDGVVDYYLPHGRWTHLITGEVMQGGRWVRGAFDFLDLPIFARAGSIIATGSVDNRPDYDFADGVTFCCYEIADGSETTCKVPSPDGSAALALTLKRIGNKLTASVAGTSTAKWKLQLAGVQSVATVENGTIVGNAAGAIFHPNEGATMVSCVLK